MRLVDPLRSAAPGELCTCGRQTLDVFATESFGEIGYCGLEGDGEPAAGWCPFCENELRHGEPRVDRAGNTVDVFLQDHRCPRYRLRLSDPVPGTAR